MRNTVYAAMIVVAALAFAGGCEKIDGKELPASDAGVYYYPDGGLVSGLSCSFDGDCGKGRYCSPQKFCWLDCRTSNDCALFQSDPSAPNNMFCSDCGRCIPKGEIDKLCGQSKKDVPCDETDECVKALSSKYVCSPRHYCTAKCTKDEDCSKIMGRGYFCTDNICTKACTWDHACHYFGWNYKCDLPSDIDQQLNTYPPAGGKVVVSECIRNPEGIDWGPYVDKAKPSYKYVGIWGEQLNTTVRSIGTPLLAYMNTTSKQYLLMKVTQGPNGTVQFNHKWCSFDLVNFLDTDEEYTNAKMITPDRYADYAPVDVNTSVGAAPEMAPDVIFPTDRFVEVRGAKLDNILLDPLPDYKNCKGGNCPQQWDQDKDGHAGMTTLMTGIITAEIYNAQRWSMMLNINVVDQDHMRGLVNHSSDQTVMDSTNASALLTLIYSMNPDLDRSYFRAMRMSDDVSCEDIAKLIKDKNSYLYWTWHCPECK
jgi:hypothetical protein